MDKRIEVLERQVGILFAALFDVMSISSQHMPPEGQHNIDQVGKNIDKNLEAIEDNID